MSNLMRDRILGLGAGGSGSTFIRRVTYDTPGATGTFTPLYAGSWCAVTLVGAGGGGVGQRLMEWMNDVSGCSSESGGVGWAQRPG